MSNREYFSGRKGQYIFCDICGQACYAYEATKLASSTGRGGLMVCPNDADQIDLGLIPYEIPVEQSVRWVRAGTTNITNAAAPIDFDSLS